MLSQRLFRSPGFSVFRTGGGTYSTAVPAAVHRFSKSSSLRLLASSSSGGTFLVKSAMLSHTRTQSSGSSVSSFTQQVKYPGISKGVRDCFSFAETLPDPFSSFVSMLSASQGPLWLVMSTRPVL
eukprot:CAMPEP_0114504176 /NCGR_PEP_ID=MMETSP0109-20121206/10064_1 /TAXON_ID=29199 /ORGANISM="Chlorarachnion reptans, Strain CCCM449" /LENGTH=124 /DNA_ID=CAMNT_0001682299 /DNA_START=801 /DNA_END=1171 /DNA_ORIENTATION=-